MKKVIFGALALSMLIVSCQKKEIEKVRGSKTNQLELPTVVSEYKPEYKFKKDLLVTDETGKNQLFYTVYSDDEEILNSYIKNNKFKVEINKDDFFFDKNIKEHELKSKNGINLEANKIEEHKDLKPSIEVELVAENLEDNVRNYSLHVETINNDNKFIGDYARLTRYVTSNSFIGVIHLGMGHEFICRFGYKLGWAKRWSIGPYTTVYPTGIYYAGFYNTFSTYRKSIDVVPDISQATVNYYIAYARDDFRSTDCTLGIYDYNNYGECYVGTAPYGTYAFIYAHNFYYTPLNGNQCPRPGSWYDGANCYVMHIPNGVDAYIWQRNWLVKSDKI